MRSTRSLALLLAFSSIAILAPSFSAAQQPPAPVVISDNVREALPNDYLRVIFVPAGVTVTTLSRPGSLRAFVTATPLYEPPLSRQSRNKQFILWPAWPARGSGIPVSKFSKGFSVIRERIAVAGRLKPQK